jgi:hypothetical protein
MSRANISTCSTIGGDIVAARGSVGVLDVADTEDKLGFELGADEDFPLGSELGMAERLSLVQALGTQDGTGVGGTRDG